MDGEPRLDILHADVLALRVRLQRRTRETYGRLNPFTEDLVDWRDRGRMWTGEDRGIALDASVTLIGDASIGEATWMRPFCLLEGSGGLSIGQHCQLARGCQILMHDTVESALLAGRIPARREPTLVGDAALSEVTRL